jgi:transcription initiation factor TFIIIB Brf1 subunit/transcription initiation factor TFIIB
MFLEVSDASQVRIEKIAGIIAACKFGIHDISRTELDPTTHLPRFNMPLELGLFLGREAFRIAQAALEDLSDSGRGALSLPEIHLGHRRARHR